MDPNTNHDDELLASLTKRIYHLEQEIIKLGGSPYVETVEKLKPEINNTVQIQNTPYVPKPEPVSENIAYAQPKPQNITTPKTSVKKNQNIENKIGKNLMAIMASVLIFISLILFGSIAFMYLSNFAKAGIMYLISIAIAVFGIKKSPKRNASPDKQYKYKTFYTSLAACGIGATYISSLISYFIFNIFNLPLFIITIIAWLVVTMILAYNYSNIFVYICNIGLIIATLLITFQFGNSLFGFIIYTICLVALYIIRHSDNFNKDCFYFMQYPIMFMILTAISNGFISYIIIAFITISVFIAANIIYDMQPKHITTNILTLILNTFAIIYFVSSKNTKVFDTKELFIYISILMTVTISVVYYMRYKNKIKALQYTAYAIMLVISLATFASTTVYDYVGFFPFAILIFLGFITKDVYLRVGGYASLFLTLNASILNENEYAFYMVCIMFLIAAYVLSIITDYVCADKYAITGIFLIATLSFLNEIDCSYIIIFSIFAIISMIMNTKWYHMNYETHKEEIASKIIGYVLNSILMLTGLISVIADGLTPSIIELSIVTLITIVLYCINTKKLFNLALPEMLIGIYICLKFTILILAILIRFEAASFVISIVGILIAIVCIILGFKVKHKSFRLYGLIVSLISVAKLMLFDIQYSSTLLRPVGFFIAGILCFAISFTYSKLEKQSNKGD